MSRPIRIDAWAQEMSHHATSQKGPLHPETPQDARTQLSCSQRPKPGECSHVTHHALNPSTSTKSSQVQIQSPPNPHAQSHRQARPRKNERVPKQGKDWEIGRATLHATTGTSRLKPHACHHRRQSVNQSSPDPAGPSAPETRCSTGASHWGRSRFQR